LPPAALPGAKLLKSLINRFLVSLSRLRRTNFGSLPFSGKFFAELFFKKATRRRQAE